VAVTWAGGVGFTMYVNGIQARTVSCAITSVTWPALVIGARRPKFPVDWFKGQLDEVGVWDRALSTAEIRELAGVTDGVEGGNSMRFSTVASGARD
jgi:hypothetical protein